MLAQIAKHEQFVKHCSLLAVLGTGALAANHARQHFRNTHPLIANTRHLKNHHTLARIVVAFEELARRADDTQHLVDMLEDALEISEAHTANERVFNRFICEINKYAQCMLREARSCRDDAVVAACVDIAGEALPALDATLDALLHNYILDRN